VGTDDRKLERDKASIVLFRLYHGQQSWYGHGRQGSEQGPNLIVFRSTRSVNSRRRAANESWSEESHKNISSMSKNRCGFCQTGEHKLVLSSAGGTKVENLVIRSVPEFLVHNSMGIHDNFWMSAEKFYNKHVTSNVMPR